MLELAAMQGPGGLMKMRDWLGCWMTERAEPKELYSEQNVLETCHRCIVYPRHLN